MAKNKLLTDDDRLLIAEVHITNRDWTAKKVRDEVRARLRRHGRNISGNWPGISVIQKELTQIRLRETTRASEQHKLDRPWSIGCISEHHILPDDLPVVMEIYKRRLSRTKPDFTIRLALWVVRLHKIIKDMDVLEHFANIYALREQIDWLFERPSSTADLDIFIMRYQENPQEYRVLPWIGLSIPEEVNENDLYSRLLKKGYAIE